MSTSFVDTQLKNKINAACDWPAAEQNIEVDGLRRRRRRWRRKNGMTSHALIS